MEYLRANRVNKNNIVRLFNHLKAKGSYIKNQNSGFNPSPSFPVFLEANVTFTSLSKSESFATPSAFKMAKDHSPEMDNAEEQEEEEYTVE